MVQNIFIFLPEVKIVARNGEGLLTLPPQEGGTAVQQPGSFISGYLEYCLTWAADAVLYHVIDGSFRYSNVGYRVWFYTHSDKRATKQHYIR